MRHLLTLVAALLLPASAFAARAIMEQTAASNNAIYIDTQTARVGVSTAAPQATLDVAGNAQFGRGATKSTFTATGSLNLASGANLTLSGGGTISGANINPASVNLSTVATTGTCTLPNVMTAISNTAVTCSQPSNVTGNAATVTNGVYTTGSYSDPSWIKSLAPSKVDGSTYTAAIALKAADSAVVHLSGSENITGAKAFQAMGSGTYSLTASSGVSVGSTLDVTGTGVFHNSGANTFSIVTSSGIKTTQINWADGTVSTTATSGGGGGGISSMQVASGTVSGGNIGTAAGPLLTATSFYLDSAGLTLTQSGNAAIIGVKNLTFVASTYSYLSTDTTFTNTTLGPCIASATINSGNNKLHVSWSGNMKGQNQGDSFKVGLLIDGAFPSGFSATHGMSGGRQPDDSAFSAQFPTAFTFDTPTALSAGSHSICVTASVSGNTGTATCSTGGCEMVVDELATGGQGYSSPASSFTNITPGLTTTAATYGVAQATVAVNMTGSILESYFSGNCSNDTGNRDCGWALLVDGAFASGMSATKGVTAETVDSNGTNAANLGSPYFITGLSSGTHQIAISFARGNLGGTATICPTSQGLSSICQFGVVERKNSAGTGDASTNGNNTFSGANTISGSLTVTGTSNMYQRVSSTSAVNDVCVGFTNLVASTTYVMECRGIRNSSSYMLVSAGSGTRDSGTNYNCGWRYINNSSTYSGNCTGLGGVPVSDSGNTAAMSFSFDSKVITDWALVKRLTFRNRFDAPNSTADTYYGDGSSGGLWNGSAAFSSIHACASTGNWTGKCTLYQLND